MGFYEVFAYVRVCVRPSQIIYVLLHIMIVTGLPTVVGTLVPLTQISKVSFSVKERDKRESKPIKSKQLTWFVK